VWWRIGAGAAALLWVASCSGAEDDDAGAAGGTGGAAGGMVAGGSGGMRSGGSGGAASNGSGGAGGGSVAMSAGGSGGAMPAPDAGVETPAPTLIGDVAFSTPSQTFQGALDVTLTTSVAGAEIRYTTDGTLPTASSEAYTRSAIHIAETTQLRAQAFKSGAASGAPSTAIYIARTFDFSSDVPIVIVDGYGGGESTDKDVYLDAAVMVFEPTSGTSSIADLPAIAARAGYHVRGQSSAHFPQTPYRVELRDNADEDADYPVLGMPADSDWALIAPYYDRTLIRNPFVYTLGREMGMQAPHWAYAEVFVNYEDRPLEEDDYQGIYWFTETIKNAKVRTDLHQLHEDDTALPAISGGYIFKFDQAAAEEPELKCTGSAPLSSGFGIRPGGAGGSSGGGGSGTCWVDLEVVDPDPLAPEQAAWLTDYVQELHDALHQQPIGDYAAYLDVASFVDLLIVNELTRNVDAYVRSAYFYKDRDDKLHAGPLWDYNFSLAVGGQNSLDPEGGFQYDGSRNVNDWYPKLTKDAAFMQQVKARWHELRQGPLSDAALDQRVADMAAPLQRAIARDYAKWPVSKVYANPGIVRGPTVESWDAQLDALRDYLKKRTAFMDAQYP
jgi:hypothetical protein